MICTGDVLRNPVTGEQLRFVKTARDLERRRAAGRALDHGLARARVRATDRDDVRAPADGKTNSKGMPNPFRLAVIAESHFDDVRLPFPPVWMQRAGVALGSPLGRLLGYGAAYEPAPSPEAVPVGA